MSNLILAADSRTSVDQSPEVDELLALDAVVAFGVSGGKDSVAAALAGHEYLEKIGHQGPRVLVHSDLGRVEWRSSLAKCEELARHLGYDLLVKKRQAGDLMDRWLVRWDRNVARYTDLSCVKLILPWSTPSMRFCTSELKTHLINALLRSTYRGQHVINVTGIRAEESVNRARMPVAKPNPACASKGGIGFTWHPIKDWSVADVFAIIRRHGLTPHEAYTRYGMSRVSCVYCVMSSAADLRAATTCEDNHDVYREMVDLEIASTFAFQGQGFLGDVAPDLLTQLQRDGLARAKEAARVRQDAEALIPEGLLYTKGWPTRMPTASEADLLASIRRRVGDAVRVPVDHIDGPAVLRRFTELMAHRPTALDAVEDPLQQNSFNLPFNQPDLFLAVG
ncbi:phosphoadenosine phosphosulfate reductase family protein [Pseudomonas aeruginosa]|uniref:phosphoadenosine phosphosulfate reductase domain-containing protein n=1 Tax=Pseudomonas aeruginosa TaxID=287 RepID=UPI0005B4FCDE|nr:phosphoadenosine phosphosulfate reductase family protein [Pseudomonas aeruginosa]EKU4838995.1 phosphoadenosine phosphosulfate reductase family protein [Pseudomonas aeruginosa]EKU5976108.1 phosphoadenosine phosphosulfate reductase family protein [Pseudomonas aeruginosa]EKX6189206.1 phosphoadenosine phosphosulfate reductase family protein [Pseudomonas aeruginosa]ELL1256559.1 phosphoadenosine phosphosulfate reductase family protein [Pseudomonas aeruginosa]ELM1689699.1 phosphoadenosine phosphos